jgi:hypothetical protein
MQDAANDLLVRIHDLGLGVRQGGRYGNLDRGVLEFLWEVGELVARGGDLRARIFGT